LTESDDKSPDLGQALLDLQSQLEEVIQDFENDTGKELSGEAKEQRRVQIASFRESMKNDLGELQNQVRVRMDQLEDRLSLLTKVMEEKPRTDSAAVDEDEPSKKSSAKDTVFGETSSSQKSSETIEDKLLYCSFCGKSQHEVVKLIAGPSVFICNECTELCNGILFDEDQQENPPKRYPAPTSCSFCNKSDDEVEEILTGPSVSICNECVDISNRIIAEREKRDVTFEMPNSTEPMVKAKTNLEGNNAELNDSDDAPEVEKSAHGLLRKVKRIFTSSQDSHVRGWPESSPSSKQQRVSSRVRFGIFVGYCCLGLLFGVGSTVIVMYQYPDVWAMGLPNILFFTVAALTLLMLVLKRVRSDLHILVTLGVTTLIGWYSTMLYLTSFAEFEFLRSVLSESSQATNLLILGGLACVGLSFISGKLFRVGSYIFIWLGATSFALGAVHIPNLVGTSHFGGFFK
jgi:hypothetical protein